MSGYNQLVEVIMFPFLPVICSVVCTVAFLAPVVPLYVVILHGAAGGLRRPSPTSCTSASCI